MAPIGILITSGWRRMYARRIGWQMAAMSLLALMLIGAALTPREGQTALADSTVATDFNAAGTVATDQVCPCGAAVGGIWEFGAEAMTATWPAVPAYAGETHEAGPDTDANANANADLVWSSTMTVGKSDITLMDYLGYITGDGPVTGQLDSAIFSHEGVDYTVTGLYRPLAGGDSQHLYLHLDKPMPDDLTLRIGSDRFPLFEAEVLGAHQNVYHWYLDASPDWIEGESMAVAFTSPLGPPTGQDSMPDGSAPSY